jgi:hypothetical protein
MMREFLLYRNNGDVPSKIRGNHHTRRWREKQSETVLKHKKENQSMVLL